MKPETRMDYLLQRLTNMNDLIHSGQAVQENDEEAAENKAKGKKDGKQGEGFFGGVMGEIFVRRSGERRPGVLGIMHPSDGHPQEELTPDFGWFRALAHNNNTWTLYWPELII
jgi:hypothetical protein